jgi:hypothetical protein
MEMVQPLRCNGSTCTGDKFPAAEQRAAAYPLDRFEEDLYVKYGFPTGLQGTVDLRARVLPDGTYLGGEIKMFEHVPRNRKLRFELAGTSIQYPYDVYWKVKNTGAQAAADNGGKGLRGEITPGHNGAQAWKNESTRYVGDHYVEIYIVQDRVCVAKAR